MKCSQEKTHAKPDPELRTEDHRYGKVRVRVWHGLHPRLSGRGRWGKGEGAPPIVRGSVIRVDVEHLPKRDGRKNKTLWLWWSGPGEPDLELCFRAYLHRFDLEHSYRFVKNTLGWTAPSPTPSCVWRADWSTTCACPGSGPAIPTSSPRRASGGSFVDFVQLFALRPVHRNPTLRDRDARREPAEPRTRYPVVKKAA